MTGPRENEDGRDATPPAATPPDQRELWNGRGGRAWADLQPMLDAMFKPFEEDLVRAIEDRAPTGVLDIGCGAGAVALAAARRSRAKGRVLGCDISGPLIETARRRADAEGSPAQFIHADAATHAFEAGAFDLLVSRFGVMFFADPVAAFANMRRALRPGGALCVQAWRRPEDNPFMTAGPRAARPYLELPPRNDDAPGQFAFADEAKVRRILERSGWSEAELTPLDLECAFPETELVRFFTQLGPLPAALETVSEVDRPRIVETVRLAFEPFVTKGVVRYTAACWRIEAKNPK